MNEPRIIVINTMVQSHTDRKMWEPRFNPSVSILNKSVRWVFFSKHYAESRQHLSVSYWKFAYLYLYTHDYIYM